MYPDINQFRAGTEYGAVDMQLSTVLPDFYAGTSQDDPAHDQELFGISLAKRSYFGDSAGFSVSVADFNPLDPFNPQYTVLDEGQVIPGHFDLDVDLTDWFEPGVATAVGILLSASADCDDEACNAVAAADNTAPIGVISPYMSLSGYDYRVVQAPVPLPPGVALFAVPAALLGLRVRRAGQTA